jgi:hypothetical protein
MPRLLFFVCLQRAHPPTARIKQYHPRSPVLFLCAPACSVLIHLLPGLAMWAHRWVPGASAHPLTLFKSSQLSYQHPDAANPLPGLQLPELSHQHPYGYFGKGAARAATSTSQPLVWLCAAPLAFYLAWQLVYFLVVQVRRDAFSSIAMRHLTAGGKSYVGSV